MLDAKLNVGDEALDSARVANLERTVQRLEATTESTAFALTSVPASLRETVSSAREHAWRAKLSATRAEEMAALHPDVLAWKSGATYAGETANRLPHGYGVLSFHSEGREIARYAGAFENGRRSGHGIGASRDGLVWSGEWKDDEACGFGLLEATDGARFEGEVAPDDAGAPRQKSGFTWTNTAAVKGGRLQAQRATPPALPSPAGQAAGG